MAAVGDSAAAHAGAAELSELAGLSGSSPPEPGPQANAGSRALASARALSAEGTACCAAGEAARAVRSLREASLAWHDLGLPYFEARARATLGRCYAALGDDDAAALEVDAARVAFERLGAAPDLAALPGRAASSADPGAAPTTPLTEREVEVVRLVAAGLTNRAIAGRLVLSEKTVARHLANIYAKLGIASRAAATAYAYDHGLR
jgi:DNA-binding CsgD family transcriptional regulator